jgi:hypothetical protein
MSSPLSCEGTHRCSPRRSRRSRPGASEEEPPGVSSSKEEPPAGIEKEEEPPPTFPPSCPMKLPPDAREEERCGSDDWSFPPHGTREEEWCCSREKQTSHSGLRLASSRALNAC